MMVERIGGQSVKLQFLSTIGRDPVAVAAQQKEIPAQFQGANIEAESEAFPREDVKKVVNSMNDFLRISPSSHLKFEYHDKLNEYYVTIVDDRTKEIVKEIPPKKLLDMYAAMRDFLGILVDKKI